MSDNLTPFFIVGAQRSGTTMLRLMLNQHSRLCVPFESAFIPEFSQRLREFGNLAHQENIAVLLAAISRNRFVQKGNLVPEPATVLARNPQSYPALIDAIFTEFALRQQKLRWGDKTPTYVLEINLLWSLFPGCRFIHLIRDGRDVALSLRSLSWGSRDLVKSARDWRWKVMLGRKMGSMIPDHYLEVNYETLVTQPAESLAWICEFLQETYEPEMLDYHRSAETFMPPESMRWHRSSVSTPNPAKIGLWRTAMSAADQFVFEQTAGDALELFEYERVLVRPTLGNRLHLARYALLGRA